MVDYFNLLPIEVLTNVISYLPRRERFICMCFSPRWKQSMHVQSLWKHMRVKLDVDFFEISTIQLTMEFCEYIRSLELCFEYPEEPMQWINYKMLDITKRSYRFLSIFVNKNLQLFRIMFTNFCDFYRSKKILYYLSMFLRSQFRLIIMSFRGSYFSKKALVKMLSSSIAANKSSIEYMDIQNAYYEHDFQVLPVQFNVLSSQMMICLTTLSNLTVLKIDYETLVVNNILEGFLNGTCFTLQYLDIRIAEHDISNVGIQTFPSNIWIRIKRRFAKLKVSIFFYNIYYNFENIEHIFVRSLPLHGVAWINDRVLLRDLYQVLLAKFTKSLEIVHIHIKTDSLDELLIYAMETCSSLKSLEFSGIVDSISNVKDICIRNDFRGFRNYGNIGQANSMTCYHETIIKLNYIPDVSIYRLFEYF